MSLFGSYARGEANDDSDVDLYIECGTPFLIFFESCTLLVLLIGSLVDKTAENQEVSYVLI